MVDVSYIFWMLYNASHKYFGIFMPYQLAMQQIFRFVNAASNAYFAI